MDMTPVRGNRFAWGAVALLLSLLVGIPGLPTSLSAQDSSTDSVTPDGWREDLDHLEEVLPRRHVNAFHTMSRDRFERRLQRLSEWVPALTDHQVAVRLARAVNAIGDGHSGFRLFSDTALDFHAFPLQLRVFPEGIHVIAAPEGHRRLVGARLDSVGGRSAEAALKAVGDVIARDNDMELIRFGPTLMVMGEVLEALAITDDPSKARFVFRKDGQQWAEALGTDTTSAFRLQGHSLLDRRAAERGWARAAGARGDSAALWLQDPTNPYWLEWLPDERSIYVQLNQVTDKSDESLADFTHRVFGMADTLPAERLVLDLRWNRGGNGYLIRPLVREIVKSEFDAEGRLYALIGRYTFSAGQMLVNELSKLTEVTYVGEPTAASPNMHGDNTKIGLPNSGLTVRASYVHWQQRDPRDDRDCTVPHVSAPVTFADYRAGRDPALEAALSGIGRDGQVKPNLATDRPSPAYDMYLCRYAAPRTGSIF